jgi:tRNA (mo5U34)-methyltransferase
VVALLQFRRFRRIQVIDYTPFYAQFDALGLSSWSAVVPPLVSARLDPAAHGDLPRWRKALAALPHFAGASSDLTADCLRVEPDVADPAERARLATLLQEFHPWRKGPFCLHGIHIDTEWHSDWKWNRLRNALDLRGATVLDVGCGNGYYGWRMLGAGAGVVIGVDPTLLYVMQYCAVGHLIGPTPNYVLPLRLEELPPGDHAFDVVFSMGVLYHRRDPHAHLHALRAHLKSGGTLCLETLVLEGEAAPVLIPAERYARMKNVWAIPTVATAEKWLADAGYHNVRCIDVTTTCVQEQRSTDWMRFESLASALDPNNPGKTCEGYPAPRRATFIARS